MQSEARSPCVVLGTGAPGPQEAKQTAVRGTYQSQAGALQIVKRKAPKCYRALCLFPAVHFQTVFSEVAQLFIVVTLKFIFCL